MKFPKSLSVFLFVSIAVISFFASALYTDTIKAALWSVNDFDSLSFDSITQTSVHLSWTLSQVNGGSQSIYRNSVYITSVAVGTSGYTSSGLSCGTTFSYDVCSVYGCASNSVTTTVCPPAAPTGLTATAVSQTQINLSWNAVSGATSYDVYKAGVLIGNTVNTGFYTVGLNCNTSYNYTVRAKNVSGDSLDSNPASATTDQCTPGTPTIGTATCTSQTAATVTWTRNSPLTESGFNIYSSGGPYRGSAGAGATSGTASGLVASTPYAFNVEAYVTTNGRTYYSARSANSNACTTLPDPPVAPTLSATAASQTQINLSWNAVSGATSYTLSRTGYGTVYSGSATSFANTGLSANTYYSYSVYASNAGGNSGWSNVASATTDQETPGTPTIGSATCTGQTGISVGWTRNSPLTESGFAVYYVSSVFAGYATAGSTSWSGTGSAGTTYQFYVSAYVNTNGRTYYSANSANSSFCTTLPNPPAPPTGFTATCSPTMSAVNLSWNPVGDATGYKITANFSPYNSNTTSNTSYSWVQGFACGNTYPFFIVSTNAGGESATKSSASCIMHPCLAPTTVTATAVSTSQINLSWSGGSTGDGYYIYRCTGSGCTPTIQLNSTNGTTYSYSDTGLSEGTVYRYAVSVYNSGGETIQSSIAEATTPVNPPSAPTLSGTTISQTQINLSWNAVSGAASYTLSRTGYGVVYSGSGTSYSDTGLSCGTSYSYTVTAANSGGTSGNSNVISQTTSACNVAPNTPTLTSPPNGSWTTSPVWCATVSDPDGNSVFAMFYDIGTGGAISGNTVASGGSSCFTGTGDWSGPWYARAVDSPGGLYSGNSATWTAYVDITAPTPNPPIVSASAASQTSLSVSMSAGTDGASGLHATAYGFSTNGSTYTWYTSNSQTLSSLTCGTNYTVYGKIKDAVGNMTSAGTTSATTDSCVVAPSAISSFLTLKETSGGGGFGATWSAAGGADGYNVYIKGGRTNPTNAIKVGGDISGTLLTQSLQGECPSSYTVSILAYATDASLGGATDSSCDSTFSNTALSGATTLTGRKCSTLLTQTLILKSCTGGFLLE